MLKMYIKSNCNKKDRVTLLPSAGTTSIDLEIYAKGKCSLVKFVKYQFTLQMISMYF